MPEIGFDLDRRRSTRADRSDVARAVLTSATAEARGPGVLHSHLDACVALLELERSTGEPHGARAALGECFELMRAATGLVPWLYGGAAQAGWAALTLSRISGSAPPRMPAIDAVVIRWTEEYPDDLDVDLPRGVLGLGVYGLLHPDERIRAAIVGKVLDVIERRLEPDPRGAFVRLAATAHRRATAPAEVGHRDLGMAHGNAGVQAFLAAAGTLPDEAGVRARRLLVPVFDWLSAQHSLDPSAVFPQSVETRYRAPRSAWCYGDPGVALSLLMAADALAGQPERSAAARALAARAAAAVRARGATGHGVHDACLCHGVAGMAHFGLRMRQLNGGWTDFTEHWCNDLVDRVAAGPLTYLFPPGRAPNVSFLEGDLGVGLVLLQAATSRRGLWEELLLTAVPDRPWTPTPPQEVSQR